MMVQKSRLMSGLLQGRSVYSGVVTSTSVDFSNGSAA